MTTAKPSKEIRVPGPDHPISMIPANGVLRISFADRLIAESRHALILDEKGYQPVFYVPREEVGYGASYKNRPLHILSVQRRLQLFSPLPQVAVSLRMRFGAMRLPIQLSRPSHIHLAFYPSRVDSIEFTSVDEMSTR